MTVNASIFKAYDIRGVYPDDFNAQDAENIAKAFVEFSGAKVVVVGRDMRISGDDLTPAVIRGLVSQGVKVIDIGLCTTPMFNFAVAGNSEYEGGIMVTASHNPPQYNGFKLSLANALPIGRDTGMDKIKELVLQTDFKSSEEEGEVIKKEILQEYLDKVFSVAGKLDIKPMKVVVDAGNGMGGVVIPDLFKRIDGDCQMMPMYFELDGTFPNHEANPIKEENVEDLKKKVLIEKADLGIAYDADGDRIGFVDEKGESIRGDLITALIARKLLQDNKGEKVLYDVRSSNIVKEVIEQAGGKSEMCMVGHALIKNLMRKNNALFAGELSSHFYYRDFYTVESDELTALLMMQIISEEDKSLSEIIRPLKKYFHSGEINSEVEDKEVMINKLFEMYKDNATEVSRIDGIRIDYEDWWFNVRASNTEPLLRLIVEAKNEELMKEKRDELLAIIRQK